MVKSKAIYYLFPLLLVTSNCRKLKNCDSKEKFTMERKDYMGNAIRMDGYYYSDETFPSFFYRNGVLINCTIVNTPENIIEVEKQVISGELHEKVKNAKASNCLFFINNDEIKFETFSRISALECWYPVTISGKILNDTTILINHKVNSDGSDEKILNSIWHFKAFSPKLDSTNSFIQ